MRLLIVLYFFVLGVMAIPAQMILPAHFPLLSAIAFGSALVPLVVIYASLELGDERAPILAGLLGLLLDLSSSPSHRLGTSVLILTSISALIITQAHRPESHQWLFRLTFVLIGTFAFMVLDYFFLQIETSQWHWPISAWSRMTFAALFNLMASPFFFLLAGLPPRWCGWKPTYEPAERLYV